MARTITITNGTTSVNLLNTGSGYQLLGDGWTQAQAGQRTIYHSSAFAEGRRPVMSAPDNVFDTINVSLTGSSHNDLAAKLQSLATLSRAALQYHTTIWQQTPVYLQVQMANETGTRYALIYSLSVSNISSVYDPPVDPGDYIKELTIMLEREPYWRSSAPHSVPTAISLSASGIPDPQADDTVQVVANHRSTTGLSKIFAYDASTTAFSADLHTSASFNYFEVSGSTPAVGDMMYFGASTPWFLAVLNISTKFVGSGVSLAKEYWDGSAWNAAGCDVGDGLCGTYGHDPHDGLIMISMYGQSGYAAWASVSINSQLLYWIRLRITAIGTWITSPAQSGQTVYIPTDTYITIADTAIDGDAPPHSLMRVANTGAYLYYNMVCGAKSRGLTNFTSRLNFHDSNPGSWISVQATDTAEIAYWLGTDGNVAKCTFATNQTMQLRSYLYNYTSELEDYTGDYFVYGRVEQSGGSVGDVSVQLYYSSQQLILGNIIQLREVNAGPEVVPLGYISILPNIISSIGIKAKSDNGTIPNLYLYDLVLIPVDEWATSIKTGYATYDLRGFDLDSGITHDNVVIWSGSRNVRKYAGNINELRGSSPRFEPDRAMNIYYLFHNSSLTVHDATAAAGASISIHNQHRWMFLRGSE